MYPYLLNNKFESFEKFMEFKVFIENERKSKMFTLHSDNGGEFCPENFDDIRKIHGMKRETTSPYSL